MAYSVDLRERVVVYRKEGHTREETREVFKVGITAIKRWEKQLTERGSLEKAPLHREPSKFKSEKLRAYIEERPDAFLKEIAEDFGGSVTGAFYALEREKLTLKKRALLQGERRGGEGGV